MPRWRFPRPRFSLLTLLIGVLFAGACGGLWWRWEPWVVVRETDWWGIAWLPEFWVAYFSGGALLVIAARNLRRGEGSGGRMEEAGGGVPAQEA